MGYPVEQWEVTLEWETFNKNGKLIHHELKFYRKGYAPLGTVEWYKMKTMRWDTVYNHPDDAVEDASEVELKAIYQALRKSPANPRPHFTLMQGGLAA